MTSGADLFVVCKQCGSEVSPYITECPYCGNRLRRRAPKLPKVGESEAPSPERRGLGGLFGRRPAPRPAERRRSVSSESGRWAHLRPHATIALVAGACVMYVVERAVPSLYLNMSVFDGLHGGWWRVLTYQFCYPPGKTGVFALVAITATGLFGWLVEHRHGPAVVLALYLGAGVLAALAVDAVYSVPVVFGGNAGAMALLGAWAARDLTAAREGSYYEGDLLGAGAFALLLLFLPFASPGSSWLASAVGGLLGLIVGAGITRIGSEPAARDL